MSIEKKHAYRFEYLKSEKWKTVRLEALVREKGHCQICGDESIFNDAHHVWYPKSIWDTTERHLVILCRMCHDFLHSVLPECKTNDEEKGLAEWTKFKNAILSWRQARLGLFQNSIGIDPARAIRTSELRKNYDDLKEHCRALEATLNDCNLRLGMSVDVQSWEPSTINKKAAGIRAEKKAESFQDQLDRILRNIKKWAVHYHDSAMCGKIDVDKTDYQI